MCSQEKPIKISKLLRHKAQEFLNSRRHSHHLVEIVRHFESGADPHSCLLTLEMVFTSLLKDRDMFVEVVPLKPAERTPEKEYKDWLRATYEGCFEKIVQCLENNDSHKIQIQGLSTAMNLISNEGKFPLELKGSFESYVPINRLKLVIMKLLSNKQDNAHLLSKYTEYLVFNDILFFTWKILPTLTSKNSPNETYIVNFLNLLEKMQLHPNEESQFLCTNGNANFFTFDEAITKRSLNKVWHCVMLWDHSRETHKQLLIVLLERVLIHLEKPLLLTDFLMDSLDVGGPVSLLALQGVFTMIRIYNLNYPNLYAKLYSMFEPEIFHTKYKARLFYLSDLFLSSSHLPENLVAAFAKRLARLALIAPSEDVRIICMFVGNLILRHPGLKCLLNHPSSDLATTSSSDPYIMEERDPSKSNAINSCLWEIQTLQQHVLPNVATAARFINAPLPNVEWDLSKLLDGTADDIFDKELKRHGKFIALALEKPNDGGSGEVGGGGGGAVIANDKMQQYWNF